MKPTQRDFETAIATMSLMKLFPAGEAAVTVLIDLLRRMVSTREQLNWLSRTLVDNIGEWPGPAQLRALFCTSFAPADGVEGPPCEIAGFTPADGERRYLEVAAERGYKQLAPGQRLLEGESESVSHDSKMAALVASVAKVKEMPSTPKTRLDNRRRLQNNLAR